jgi:hypothetical protein
MTSFDLKAAALAVGTVMVVPYLAISSFWQWPTPGETRALAIAALLIVIFPLLKVPVGFAAALAFLIMQRARLMPTRIGSMPLWA